MMVSVLCSSENAPKYRNCKSVTAINVLGVYNWNIAFVYCLSGWPGSAHDGCVLRDVMARNVSFSVPPGKYYLGDAAYTNARRFLTPYRGTRYHLTEWGPNRPRNKEELSNLRHSSARNVIEWTFGIMKMRWALIPDSSWFSLTKVSMIVNACALLHNYIRRVGSPDIFEQAYHGPDLSTSEPEIPTDDLIITLLTAVTNGLK